MLCYKQQSHFSGFSDQHGKKGGDRVLRSHQDLSFGHAVPRTSVRGHRTCESGAWRRLGRRGTWRIAAGT